MTPTSPSPIPQNEYEHLRAALQAQPEVLPPSRIRSQVLQQTVQRGQPVVSLRSPFQVAWGLLMSAAILVLMWAVIQPGVVLQWAWQSGDLKTFRVYRADPTGEDFALVGVLPTQESAAEYTFVDSLLIPGKDYTYLVEGIDQNGHPAFQQTLEENGLAALPGQLALVIASLLLAYAMMTGLQRGRKRTLHANMLIVS